MIRYELLHFSLPAFGHHVSWKKTHMVHISCLIYIYIEGIWQTLFDNATYNKYFMQMKWLMIK